MLRMDNQNINFNGASMVGDTEVASMSANFSNGVLYFNYTINNINTFKVNKITTKTDMDDFRNQVIETIEGLDFSTITENTDNE